MNMKSKLLAVASPALLLATAAHADLAATWTAVEADLSTQGVDAAGIVTVLGSAFGLVVVVTLSIFAFRRIRSMFGR